MSFVFHSPIIINNDSDFASQASSEGWQGDGTASSPYVIEGYDINASGYRAAVAISNTRVHFVVDACYLHEALWSGFPPFYTYGILLSNVTNGTLTGNVCMSNELWGIATSFSSNVVISNNICSSNGEDGIRLDSSTFIFVMDNWALSNGFSGIFLNSSSANTIENNTCSSNSQSDICVTYFSNDNTIVNNTCSSNGEVGISLVNCYSNILRNNKIVGSGIEFGGKDLLSWNTQDIDVSNTVNGKSLCYFKNATGGTVQAGAGQVILANCTNMVVENQDLCDTSIGIQLGYSSNNLLLNNNCSRDIHGVSLYYSSHNTINNSICVLNTADGIHLESSSTNTLDNNTCSGNGVVGIFFWDSDSNTISNDNCSANNGTGTWLGSSLVTGTGIWLGSSAGEVIDNCSCFLNSMEGVHLYYSDGCTITNCSFSSNAGEGVSLVSFSSDNRIWNNTFIGNNGATDTYDPSHVQARDDGNGNWWNSTDDYGNYWSDWTIPDVAPPYGIVDVPYDVSGSAGAKDYYPQATPQVPIPEFGMMYLVLMVLPAMIVLTRKAKRRKTH